MAEKAISIETADILDENEIDDEAKLFTRVELNETESEHIAATPYSYWKAVFRTFIKRPAAIVALATLGLLILGMIIIPLFAPASAYVSNVSIANLPPSAAHLFGTDAAGRDLFFMCWKGMSLSLLLALIESSIVIIIGTVVGIAWGYFKWLDPILIEIYNLISNIPSLLLYILIAIIMYTAFPDVPSTIKMIVSLSITSWIGVALFIRNQTIIITNREYNVASITLGTPSRRIMSKNLFPYLLAVIITEVSLMIPGMVSSEVSMSFFGVGLSTDTIAIGVLLDFGRRNFIARPWQLLFPALMLGIIIFIFYITIYTNFRYTTNIISC